MRTWLSTGLLLTVPFVFPESAAAQIKINANKNRNAATPVPVASGIAPEPITMKTVNQRWGGTRCQIRVPLEIRKDKDSQGWSASAWKEPPRLPKEQKQKFRLLVSNRALLEKGGHLSKRTTLRAGTIFVSEGWRFADPKKNRGLVLDLRFEGIAVKARMEFDRNSLDDLEALDTVNRVQLFQLLDKVQAAEPAPMPAAVPAAIPAAPASGVAPAAHEPAVVISAVSVMPATVARGAKVDLIVVYTVSGVPPGVPFQVMETREIRSGEKQLASFQQPVQRNIGTYTSKQTINVPADLAAGVYVFEPAVSLAGKVEKSRALFEVK